METGEFSKLIFKIIGVLVVSLLLYSFIFGNTSVNLMYEGMTKGYQSVWNDATSNSGKDKTAVMSTLFNAAHSQEE